MKKVFGWCVLGLLAVSLTAAASAQSVDGFVGLDTLLTPPGPSSLPKLGGGAYINAGGDLIFLPYHLGIGGDATWRATQQDYLGAAARPIYYDFNLVWDPSPTDSRYRPDFAIGVGMQSLRFYNTVNCGAFGCSYPSSHHFVLHAAVGLKIYLSDHLFLRPAVNYFNIRHNYEYGVPSAWQVGVSIGYTLGSSS